MNRSNTYQIKYHRKSEGSRFDVSDVEEEGDSPKKKKKTVKNNSLLTVKNDDEGF